MTDVPPASWRYRLFLAAYSAVLTVGSPLIWRYFRRRGEKDPAYLDHWAERRGQGAAAPADVWVHAVSLGEMRSAVPLVQRFLDAGLTVVTTHLTPAGRRAAEDAFPDEITEGSVVVRYAPVDRARYWRAFLAAHAPRAGVVMEMEFWPWMIEAAGRAGVPLFLANSQIPSRSMGGMLRQAQIFGHPAARAACVFAKSERMAQRFRALGAARIEVMGETRFDIAPPTGQLDAAKRTSWPREVVTFASVVAGEEEVFANAARALLDGLAPPLIVWVPRAPELFGATAERLAEAGFRVARRSEALGADLSGDVAEDTEILVGDSLGEMFFYLAPAAVVVVGGGFVPKGAHNVIEPLALGKPVITGPQVWTIEYPAVEAQDAGVLTVTEPDDLADAIRIAMSEGEGAAAAFHASNAGASDRIAERVMQAMEDNG